VSRHPQEVVCHTLSQGRLEAFGNFQNVYWVFTQLPQDRSRLYSICATVQWQRPKEGSFREHLSLCFFYIVWNAKHMQLMGCDSRHTLHSCKAYQLMVLVSSQLLSPQSRTSSSPQNQTLSPFCTPLTVCTLIHCLPLESSLLGHFIQMES
jgi:hypothetical protein